MRVIRKYWKGNEKKFIESFIKFPYFLIHEFAHIIFNIILGNKMCIEEYSFYKEVKNGIRFYSLSLDVVSKNTTFNLFGLLAPSIVWLSIVSYSLYDLYYNHTISSFLILSYSLYCFKIANISRVDWLSIKECYKEMSGL